MTRTLLVLPLLAACAAPVTCPVPTAYSTVACANHALLDARCCPAPEAKGDHVGAKSNPTPDVPGGHEGGGQQVDTDDHSEDPNRDPAKYEHWKETGVWK